MIIKVNIIKYNKPLITLNKMIMLMFPCQTADLDYKLFD